MKKTTTNSKLQEGQGSNSFLSEANAAWVLDELDAVAEHIFQLRKAQIFLTIPDAVRESLLNADRKRAEHILALVNGDQQYLSQYIAEIVPDKS
ncbi:hypothetical protein PuT2_14750 [Pusillimonas sp. T2]|uniref:hypothetical protein n=1 Tax=Pusillimonas sp. T2 TaxID=1548123 RepID=UPI000B8B7E3F|nr:hypothetical protein [Pusillimonas sp. T2]OXR48054.1 hypothetical protein PuT2_14750 [Pusillimonas sp. T2]